ncbi:MAG: hypothetical protein MJZ13_10555 [Bacteroidales bacterium]|nr:hypothetical protein [Bacteroidales bacterium]
MGTVCLSGMIFTSCSDKEDNEVFQLNSDKILVSDAVSTTVQMDDSSDAAILVKGNAGIGRSGAGQTKKPGAETSKPVPSNLQMVADGGEMTIEPASLDCDAAIIVKSNCGIGRGSAGQLKKVSQK